MPPSKEESKSEQRRRKNDTMLLCAWTTIPKSHCCWVSSLELSQTLNWRCPRFKDLLVLITFLFPVVKHPEGTIEGRKDLFLLMVWGDTIHLGRKGLVVGGFLETRTFGGFWNHANQEAERHSRKKITLKKRKTKITTTTKRNKNSNVKRT